MKILSKFKDYYDGAANFSGDTDLIYKREKKTVKIRVHRDQIYKGYQSFSFNEIDYLAEYFHGEKVKKMQPFLIGFCGKMYPGIQITDNLSVATSWYSMAALEEYLKEIDHKVHAAIFKPDGKFYEYLKSFFANKDNYQDVVKDMLAGAAPVTVVNEFNNLERDKNTTDYAFIKCENNPKLKDYEFFKVQEPYTAFQELYMYLGAQSNPEKEIVQISDKDKIKQHGFDPKYGFRKTPSKYKRK